MREEITRILYENSSDDSYCMKIKFENVEKIIDQLLELKSTSKPQLPTPPPSRKIAEGEPICKCGSSRRRTHFFSTERECRNKECKL